MKSIYILITQTHTGFAGAVRRFAKVKYNHAAIALDENLTELYAFARPKHSAVMLARLVKESMFRYSLGKHSSVDCTIFKLDITDEQYEWVYNTIQGMLDNRDYMYNLFSVLSTPLTGGFATYQAFSCIEFIVYLLKRLGYPVDKPLYRYRPDDLISLLSWQVHFQGNLLIYKPDDTVDECYYEHLSVKEVMASMVVPFKLVYRLMFKRKQWAGQ